MPSKMWHIKVEEQKAMQTKTICINPYMKNKNMNKSL